jgi:DNA-directed RNA polymerase subunit M/transcription elongation factor TFIIS
MIKNSKKNKCFKCGCILSAYNKDKKCFTCQKNGRSIEEMNEALAVAVKDKQKKSRRYSVRIEAPVELCEEVWDELERKIRRSITQNRLKVTLDRL